MRHLFLASLFLVAPLAASAQTTSLPISNYNFETGGLPDGSFSNGSSVAIPTGWAAIPNNAPSGGNYGYFNPQNNAYANTTGSPGTIGTMDGPNVFYFGSSTTGQGIQQTLSSNFALDTMYHLTVSLGCRSVNTYQAELSVQLLAGSTVVASGTYLNSTPNTFTDQPLNYTSTAADSALAGMPLTIRLSEFDQNATVTEVDIDNVRLTTNPAPEPSAFLGVAAGAILLAAVGIKRRASGATMNSMPRQ